MQSPDMGWLRAWRLRRGWTQLQAATALGYSSSAHYSVTEAGKVRSPGYLQLATQALDARMEAISEGPEAFCAWLDQRGYSVNDAARALMLDASSIRNYRRGVTRVGAPQRYPLALRLACAWLVVHGPSPTSGSNSERNITATDRLVATGLFGSRGQATEMACAFALKEMAAFKAFLADRS